MRRIGLLLASMALTVLLACGVARTATERPASVLEACVGGKEEIVAEKLPREVEPGRCPIGERPIVDHGVGVVLPDRGEGIYAEVMTTSGAQELDIVRHEDGSLELSHLGDDSGDDSAAREASDPAPAGGFTATTSSPDECRDRAYTDLGQRVSKGLRYYFNRSTTPAGLTRKAAEGAIRRGGTNIVTTKNNCDLGDRVPAYLAYGGTTASSANVDSDSKCRNNDDKSVASFGNLPSGVLAVNCNWYYVNPNGYDEVDTADIKIRAGSTKWTTKPSAASCTDRYDLESVMTHERGHTFGLGHVSESKHGNLTMSTSINGPCQASERTLGKGDVLGLDRKYP